MATGDTIGLNRDFPIYNADGTAFNDLVLKKATVDSIIMSLGDKITGDVYYKDNTLAVTMQEYIEYKRNPDDEDEDAVKYMLVNPPTVVREGMASDNGEMKGMTKYSFTFYHPMCLLANFPFSDVAVSPDQMRYLSENKTFPWIGTLQDYVEKLNKNLEGTQWIVVINYSSVAQEDYTKLSDVLTFDKQSIADALKTGYETWKVPYVVESIKAGAAYYSEGKRFMVWFGLPTEEIYPEPPGMIPVPPFVFKFGQGVGLKNNSRTPRNNKIITRIAGYGSEDNIPYGYPQIQWYGDDDASFTYGDHAGVYEDVTIGGVHFDKVVSYPIYEGIVGGAYVKLIKHPFTRTHLMPSVYVESLFNKISPYTSLGTANADYDPDTELVDYYDAVNEEGETPEWENPIKTWEDEQGNIVYEPSYEIHEFTDIKPELGDMQLVAVETYDDTAKDAISMDEFMTRLNDYYSESENEDEKDALQHLMDSIAVNDEDAEWSSGTRTSYQYDWRFTSDGYFKYVTYKSSLLNFENTVLLNPYVTPTPEWDDTMDDDGNYVQSYFKVTLPALGFDLYACAAITQEMSVNMRSGACIGCTFPVMVDWDDYKKNFYDADGNFDPVIGEGHPRNGQKYPDSTLASISVVLQKDNTTFGTLMPNIYQQPAYGDKFVILGISLPQSYVTIAESRLDNDMIQYMHDNNVYYYDYPLKFDEHFLANHAYILSQMRPNVVVRFEYADEMHALYIKQMTVKYGNKPLPEYNITLTDDVEIVLNQIGQVTQEVSNLRLMLGGGDGTNTSGDTRYLRKDKDDTASGLISFIRGLQVGERFVTGLLGEGGIFRKDADGTTYLECDRMYVRMKAYFDTVEVRRFIHSGGNRVASAAGIKCSRVEYYTQNGLMTTDASEAAYFRCYFRANDNGTEITNDFEINDLAYCKETNIVGEQANTTNAVATRSASSNRSVSEENITISLVITNNTNSSITLDGDARFVLSNPDVDGNYHGWQGSYNRTERMVFSNSAVTLAAGESRTVTLSGELYRRSPAGDTALAEAGQRSNVLLYVGGVSEVVLCSKLSSSIVFQNGGTYNVSLSQGGHGISQRFYWRKVIGVSSAVTSDGEHYIDLSATDCATGSDVPIAQDDIIQLGNTTDTTRQGAIIEFVSGEDAPSYQIYQGINTYSLLAKNYVRLGYDSESGGAQAYIGNPDGSTYLWYHLVTEGGVTTPQLDIKANVEFISPDPVYGTENLDDFVNAITQDMESIEDMVVWFGTTAPTMDNYPVNTWEPSEYHEHIGDLFYDKTNDHGYRFVKTAIGDVVVFTWEMVDDNGIIEALRAASKAQDTADGKRRVFLTQPTPPYDTGDIWVNATYPANYTGATDELQHKYHNDILKCIAPVPRTESGSEITTFSIYDWTLSSKYTDDSRFNHYIDVLTNGIVNPSGDLEVSAAAQHAINVALQDGASTIVNGGLVLTNVIALLDGNASSSSSRVMSGINGTYNSTLRGGGIAAWYGGPMVDHEASPSASSYAKTLFRFDGTGYLAGGNITWNANGSGSVAGGNLAWNENGQITSIAASNTITVGGSDVLTQSTADSRYVTIDFFNRLFQALDGSGNTITTNSTSGTINALKFLQSVWSTGAVSALGANGSGGGGSSLVLNNPLLSINGINANPTTANSMLVWNGTSWGYKTTSEIGSSYAATAGRLSDNTSYTAWGQTFFTNGVPTSISNAPLSGVTNINSSLYFNGNDVGIGTSSPGVQLDVVGQIITRHTAGAAQYKMQFGNYTRTLFPFLHFYDYAGKQRSFAELETVFDNDGTRTEYLLLCSGFREVDQTNKIITKTYLYGGNIHFFVTNTNDTSSTSVTTQAMRMFVNGRTFVGTVADQTSLRNINNSSDHPCALNAYSALIGRLYLYKPNTDNDTNAVWFEYDGTNGSVKLNGSFYATGGASALGIVGSGGGSSVTLGNVLNHINTHDATSFSPSTDSVLLFKNGVWGSMTLSQLGASVTTDCVKTSGTQIIGGAKTFSDAITIGSNGSISSYNGFVIAGLSNANDYVLLAGGGTKALSEIGGGGSVSIVLGSGTPYNPVQGVITLPAYPTDENVKVVTTNPNSETTYYPLWTNASNNNTTNGFVNDGLKYVSKEGTSSIVGIATLQLGNAIASGTSKNKKGQLSIFSNNTRSGSIVVADNITSSWTYTLPNKSGTFAMTDDITSDTKNTAGATNNTNAMLYLVGAATQTDNPITYSRSNCYISSDGYLYSGGTKVLTSHQSLAGYATETWVNSQGFLTSGSVISISRDQYNVNTRYDAGFYQVANGSNCPSEGQYGVLLSLPYRKASGNTKPDFAVQIYAPCGDDGTYPNGLFYRTSIDNAWNAWQRVVTVANNITTIGNRLNFTNSSVYITRSTAGDNKTILNLVAGYVQANGVTVSSDMRQKDVKRFIDDVTVNSIAFAPIFEFTRKDEEDPILRMGSSAQYWKPIFPCAVAEMTGGFLSLDYSATALVSTVITARKVVDHEHRIQQLEWENERLRKEIEQLKAA